MCIRDSVNTERRETSRYTFLHRSGCHHLAGLVEGQGPNGYTQREYIKVCSENAEALLAWCLQERTRSKGFSGYCKTCRPEHIDRSPINYADELPEKDGYVEGAATRVTVNAYERSSKARAACLLYYGFKCAVCGLEFDKKYGDIGHGFRECQELCVTRKRLEYSRGGGGRLHHDETEETTITARVYANGGGSAG